MVDVRTRGHPVALATVTAYIRGRPPHAILLAGPTSVGKTTLALDFAAGLLCEAPEPADRPCGRCRACRRVRGRNHPDLHWLGPVEPGRQIVIGGEGGSPRGVRQLTAELALSPLEGRVRVAIVEAAERMNEAAQNAFLKTLEEPPPASVIVLCADGPDRLLPTIRSRCAVLRLGLVGVRTIEALLVERDLAEPPLAGRLARLADGRPGLAVAYALAPAALAARAEIARSLLDLLDAPIHARLAAVREAMTTALEASLALAAVGEAAPESPVVAAPEPTPVADRASTGPGDSARDAGIRAAVALGSEAGIGGPPGGARVPAAAAGGPEAGAGDLTGRRPRSVGETDLEAADLPESMDDAAETARSRRAPAVLRRRAAHWLVEAWRDLARDLLVVDLGRPNLIRDVGLLDELAAAAGRLARLDLVRFVDRTLEAEAAIEANATPELVLDILALTWPRAAVAA